jgi:energy-coupling factor transporter transmembrane protein EcfT
MPVSVAITAIGAVVMLIAVFLPRVESNTLLQVAKNTMVQTGEGWWFIALAVGVAGATWRAYHQQVRSWVPTVLGGIAIAVAIYYGTNKGSLTLCPVQSELGIGCSKASAGVGIYAAGVGGVLALLGGLQIGHAELVEGKKDSEDEEPDTPETESADLTSRLRTLEALRADSLITDDEYAARRTALLDEI